MKVSKHFTLEEFTYSDTAKKYNIDNTPNEFNTKIIIHTAQYLLEPLRDLLGMHYGKTVYITITSGYRCPTLNSKIGGSNTSQHKDGYAVDIETYYMSGKKKIVINYIELYNLIKQWVKQGKLSVDQCIQEHSGNSKWVHISHHPSGRTRDRRQFLKYDGKTYTLDTIL